MNKYDVNYVLNCWLELAQSQILAANTEKEWNNSVEFKNEIKKLINDFNHNNLNYELIFKQLDIIIEKQNINKDFE